MDDIPHKESNIDGKCNELTYKLMQDVVKKIDDLALEVKDLKTGNFTLLNFSEEKKIEISSENRSDFTSDSPVMVSCSVNEIVMKYDEFIVYSR